MVNAQDTDRLYVIVLTLNGAATLKVGAKGAMAFVPGTYLYVGSAARGLSKRVARHKAIEGKKPRWHIDYFRPVAKWAGAVAFSVRHGECRLAKKVARMVKGVVEHPRFGASDCRCSGHLIRTDSKAKKVLPQLLSIGGRLLDVGGAKARLPIE